MELLWIVVIVLIIFWVIGLFLRLAKNIIFAALIIAIVLGAYLLFIA
jgi:hypothetical protein